VKALLKTISISAVFMASLSSVADIHEKLAEKLPSVQKNQIAQTDSKNIYSVDLGDKYAYVTEDGNYLFTGDMIDLTAGVNISQQELGKKRIKTISMIPDNRFITFPAQGKKKHSITVFTDIDCTWCRRLHAEIADYNKRGIEVRYLMRPRSGPQSNSWQKADSVFCSKDQQKTLTNAKQGQEIKLNKCKKTPTMENVVLAESMGFMGTPVVLSEQGMYLGGYVAPAELETKLNSAKARLN